MALLIIFAVLAAVFAGFVGLFTGGTVVAVIILVLVVGGAAIAIRLGGNVLAAITAAFVLAVVGAVGFIGYTGYTLARAFSDTDGPADPADPEDLASAKAKIDGAKLDGGFRLEFTAEEATAVIQDALATGDSNPIRRVTLTVIDGEDGENGHIDFKGDFKSGSTTASGSIGATVDAGRMKVEVRDVSMANLSLPGFAKGGVEDLIETITDLESRLDENKADIQSVTIGDGKVVITGSTAGGAFVSLDTVFGGIRENVQQLADAATPPAETLGAGVIDALESDGPSYYVALGDSLAANVGVANPKDGYVSRLHNQLQLRDGAEYGLRNYGVSGETSGTIIRLGQLDSAVEFIEDNPVAYVTIDIGANDLLGHIYSPDCEASFSGEACQARLETALTAYETNLEAILDRLADAADNDTTIVFLLTYNPFSFGFGEGNELEVATNDAVSRLNAVASEVAERHDIAVADGFTALAGKTAGVTHMLDNPADIHPLPVGYDLLAAAILAAIP
ncbi:MAG TPA: SGNH/GDSL hydrolase family protein [Tepidiformaceae bacterium]|nr:SGNH/GDSL hydrolase family protein [Tepidiformaceae bacterium]